MWLTASTHFFGIIQTPTYLQFFLRQIPQAVGISWGLGIPSDFIEFHECFSIRFQVAGSNLLSCSISFQRNSFGSTGGVCFDPKYAWLTSSTLPCKKCLLVKMLKDTWDVTTCARDIVLFSPTANLHQIKFKIAAFENGSYKQSSGVNTNQKFPFLKFPMSHECNYLQPD